MNEKQTVLVVDDEEKIRALLKSYLEINGYAALCARDGGEAMALFERHAVSLILLDLMLPGVSGEEFCRRVREVSGVPIIMITAKTSEADIIRGLKMGADDYVTKPFSPRELMARVEAALRRTAPLGGARILRFRDLVIDTEQRSVTRYGNAVVLTRDADRILALLLSRQAKIFTREEIMDAVKGDDYDAFDRIVDAHIKKIRAKIGDDSKAPAYITTVYGMGYRIGGTL
jgi:DNA-binding response OmpR family regulator